MPSEHSPGGGRYDREEFPEVEAGIGEDPARFLDREQKAESDGTLDGSTISGTLALARIRGLDDLEAELDRLGADKYRYSFDARQRKSDQRPYSRANPDDPGFVLRWTMGGGDYALACDDYDSLRGNVRAVGLYLREKRKMENRPVVTGEDEFANARLPPGDGDEAVVVADAADEREPHEALDVSPDAGDAVVRGAARAMKKQHHPDNVGAREEFQRIVEAEKAMLGGEDRGE